MKFTLVFLLLLFSNSCENTDAADHPHEESAQKSAKIIINRDPRIEGEWFVYGFNDVLEITPQKISISDNQGNNYPTGNYKIAKMNTKGGSGEILVDENWEPFHYRFENDDIIFTFQRIGVLRCSKQKWD